METQSTSERDSTEKGEIARLEARVAELEAELTRVAAAANAAVAEAQDRSYWLDRMRIDLNAVMRRPLARAAFSACLAAVRVARRVKRRLS